MYDIVGRRGSGDLTDGVCGLVDNIVVKVAHLLDLTRRPDSA